MHELFAWVEAVAHFSVLLVVFSSRLHTGIQAVSTVNEPRIQSSVWPIIRALNARGL